ncbi:TAXI family TRAP transporter solute-binding subunit [Minwuia sp.]|uniref:TAXI family TRAP transporter solute-binding subunit n=1 Tax=Minwuia sp. TaxID=2493630 RepID=UPI003A910DBA
MMMKLFSRLLPVSVAAAGLLAFQVQAQDKTFLTMDSNPPGTTVGQFMIAFTQVVQKNLPIEIQISTGKPATKSAVDAALQKVDLYTGAPTINWYMQNGAAMFAKVKNAAEMNKDLRGLINYPLGPYQIVTYADSGIETLDDIKGRKVFLGPPAGAATKVMKDVVQAVTGLEPDAGYEAMRYDWSSAETAFLDGQMDVYIVPTSIPSPQIQQFALVRDIRILGIPKEKFDHELIQAALKYPGRTIWQIPPGVYENQVNTEAVDSIGSWVGIQTQRWLDEQLAYDMVRTFFENLDEIHATAPWMKVITLETALNEMNVPLHPGAYRYYKEQGIDIPATLVPPQAN